MSRISVWTTLLALSLVGGTARGEDHATSGKDLAPLLAAIEAVGPHAAGHREAALAWRQLADADARQLPEILAALDRAGPLAANWIGTAVDAIAQRELDRGGALPAKQLESLALDTRHSGRARRLAYEWLVQVDPAAPDRLLDRMLDDRCLEMRRDAVARRIDRAESAEKADPHGAVAGYREALGHVADPDQVQLIAQRLRRLGQTVDVPRCLGLIVRWKVLGPLDNTGDRGFDRAEGPEPRFDPDASYSGKHGTVRWIDAAGNEDLGLVDLNRALGQEKEVTGYAVTLFEADRAAEVEFRMASFNAVKLWLNGRLIDSRHVYHSGSILDQYVSRATLRPGRNVILVKVCQNEQKQEWAADWSFQLRVCDANGRPVLSSDRMEDRD